MKNKNLISEAIANGYNFNIGNYISRGMDIFKKNPGGYTCHVIYFDSYLK